MSIGMQSVAPKSAVSAECYSGRAPCQSSATVIGEQNRAASLTLNWSQRVRIPPSRARETSIRISESIKTDFKRRFSGDVSLCEADAHTRSNRAYPYDLFQLPTKACIASLRFARELPYFSRTASRTSSEMDVPRCRDRTCSAFQISSFKYNCVRFISTLNYRLSALLHDLNRPACRTSFR